MSTRSLALLIGVLLCPGLWAAPVVEMTSLEWPPYAGESLPNQGMVVQYAAAIFARMGYELKVTFLPWRRAVRAVEEQDRYAGFFPEYSTPTRESQFYCSQPMMYVPLSIVESGAFPHRQWRSLKELSAYRIGVVSGYLNTPEFDTLVINGVLHTEEAPSDLLNIRKVAAGRLPMAVVDPDVLDYYLKQEPELVKRRSAFHLPAHIIGSLKLVACFKRTPEGKKWRDIFDQGLAQLATRPLPTAGSTK
jgi:ABC-type amino acid transport/signal transduction systems, periplasmic component/domain